MRDGVALALALIVHLSIALGSTLVSRPSGTVSVDIEPIVVELELQQPPEEESVRARVDATATDEPAWRRAGAVVRSRPRGPVASALAGSGAVDGPAAGVVEPPSVPAAVIVVPDIDVTLDPAAVARGVVIGLADGPVAPPQSGRSIAIPRRSEREAEERVTGDLRATAMSKAYVTRRGPVRLTARPDGSYHHDGLGFDADIRPDGRVEFHDRDDARIDPVPRLGQTGPLTDVTGAQLDPPLFHDPPVAVLGFGGDFDLDSPLARTRGEDPHRFERERFLEETRALRERLEDATREGDLARARRRRRDAGAE